MNEARKKMILAILNAPKESVNLTLTEAQADLLQYIVDRGQVSIGELATSYYQEEAHRGVSFIHNNVERLLNKGYLVKSRDTKKNRNLYAPLTAQDDG